MCPLGVKSFGLGNMPVTSQCFKLRHYFFSRFSDDNFAGNLLFNATALYERLKEMPYWSDVLFCRSTCCGKIFYVRLGRSQTAGGDHQRVSEVNIIYGMYIVCIFIVKNHPLDHMNC